MDEKTSTVTPTLSWTSAGMGSVTLRPWLTDREMTAVQSLFTTKLRFEIVYDEVLGPGTMISPRIGERDRPLVARTLWALWQEEGINPGLRPSRRTQAPLPVSPTGKGPHGPVPTCPPSSRDPRTPERPRPKIVFSSAAYAKYRYMAHANGGMTEIGGYGVHELTGPYRNVIYIREFVTVRQHVTSVFCKLDQDHANEVMSERCMRDEGFNPNQFMACWCHSHPGDSVTPSSTDWDSFAGHNTAGWAAMIILGRGGRIGAHIRQRGPLRDSIMKVPVDVDWEHAPDVADLMNPKEWREEYLRNIWPSAQEFHADRGGECRWWADSSAREQAVLELWDANNFAPITYGNDEVPASTLLE